MKRRLDEILVMRGLCESRSLAQRLIMEGKVHVRDVVSPKAGNRYPTDIPVEVSGDERFVSRGGFKLEEAVEICKRQVNVKAAGLVKKELDGVKVLANGDLTKKFTVKVNAYSEAAKAKIEAAGGTAEVVE